MEMMDEKETKNDSDKKYEKYELEDACNTLMKAEAIKQDKEMMTALRPMLDKKHQALKAIADTPDPKKGLDGLRKVASKKIEENAKD